MHASFMNMILVRRNEKIEDEGRVASSWRMLRTDAYIHDGATLDICYGGSDIREEWYIDSHVCWSMDIDFEIRSYRQHKSGVVCSLASAMSRCLMCYWLVVAKKVWSFLASGHVMIHRASCIFRMHKCSLTGLVYTRTAKMTRGGSRWSSGIGPR